MPARFSPASVSLQEWTASVEALLDLGRGTEALTTLERAVGINRVPGQMAGLLQLLERFPPELQASGLGVRLRLRLLGNVGGGVRLVKQEVEGLWAAGRDDPFLHVFFGWALAEQLDNLASLHHTGQVLSATEALSPFERVLLWRTRGRTLARSDQNGWREAFELALAEAQGRSHLMTLAEYAAIQSRSGDIAGAMSALSEALRLAKHDPLEISITEQLGLLCLGAGEFEDAERHFRQMERLSAKPEAKAVRSHALCSLASARRAMGEWERAEQLYDLAFGEAAAHNNEEDQRRALWGIGHTRRLAGRPLSALEALEQAARVVRSDRESGQSWVYVDIAAALVSLPQATADAVEQALARAGAVSQEDAERATVVRAELARRSGNPQAALALLRSLTPGKLLPREEAHAFPALFELLPPSERPAPLPRPQQTVVQFRAAGFPVVTVNGREVSVPPLGVVVLAALLEHGQQASLDTLTEVLEDGRPRSRRQAEQRVSKAVGTLRRALGWENSVATRPRHYVLDAKAQWHYDVAEALMVGKPVEAFLSGIDLPWVSAREQDLSLRD